MFIFVVFYLCILEEGWALFYSPVSIAGNGTQNLTHIG